MLTIVRPTQRASSRAARQFVWLCSEVESPGILLPGLTIAELREGVSRVRNRVLARVFIELGLIEQWSNGRRGYEQWL